MRLNRRTVIALAGAGALGIGGYRFFFDQGIRNPCTDAKIPDHIRQNPMFTQIWQAIDQNQLWDAHAHLVGLGDSDSGIWVNPKSRTWLHPLLRLQLEFYFNAACVKDQHPIDLAFVQHLTHLHQAFPVGAKVMLMAFDHHYTAQGEKNLTLSPFYVPNAYTASVAQQYPQWFEWIASVHPYRADAVDVLQQVIAQGARAIKWLPPSMGIDPSSPLCDAYFQVLAKHQIPLITHGGDEKAVHSGDFQRLGNPLLLRRALGHGVKVVVAHCATLGVNQDIDQGPNGKKRENFALFARMMDEAGDSGTFYGEISAVAQRNRVDHGLAQLLQREDWHPRLINGSDYPLPGVMPLFSLTLLARRKMLTSAQVDFLTQLRRYNPLLFDFALKRLLSFEGQSFQPIVFASRRIFTAT